MHGVVRRATAGRRPDRLQQFAPGRPAAGDRAINRATFVMRVGRLRARWRSSSLAQHPDHLQVEYLVAGPTDPREQPQNARSPIADSRWPARCQRRRIDSLAGQGAATQDDLAHSLGYVNGQKEISGPACAWRGRATICEAVGVPLLRDGTASRSPRSRSTIAAFGPPSRLLIGLGSVSAGGVQRQPD